MTPSRRSGHDSGFRDSNHQAQRAPLTARKAARRLIDAGISVLPIKADGSKAPNVPSWKTYQTGRLTHERVDKVFSDSCGIGVIAGAVSGNLEIIDVEGRADNRALIAAIEDALPGVLDMLPQVLTPSGGLHIFYRCDEIEGNQKLASQDNGADPPRPEVLIETRGEGGYVLTVGSPADCHPSGIKYQLVNGKISQTPTITTEQRRILLDTCRSFNTWAPPEKYVAKADPGSAEGKPGHDFSQRGDIVGLLQSHGWAIERSHGDEVRLVRPGKKHGISGTWHDGKRVFYVFSSNAAPFEPDQAYSGFAVFALLECAGDFSAAAGQLAKQGYGDPPQKVVQPAPKDQAKDAMAPGRELEGSPELLEYVDLPESGGDNSAGRPSPDLTRQPYTDAGNADRLLVVHGADIKYVHERRKFYAWDRLRWKVDSTRVVKLLAIETARATYRQAPYAPVDLKNPNDDKDDAAKRLRKHARKSESAKGVRDATDLLCSLKGVTISAGDLDADPYLLGVANGVVDLRTGKLLPARREYLITKSTRAKYDPNAKCECFLRFLSSAMGVRPDASEGELVKAEERIRFLQKGFGSALSGCVDDKAMFVFYGPTNSGKTTLLEAIRYPLGDYAGQILIDSLLSNSRQSDNNSQADLADMHGRRFVTTSEAESSQQLSEGKLKYLTQGQSTKIKVARKYENPIEFSATHKLFLDANELPRIKTSDDSVWNRLKPVPFEFRVPNSEIDLKLPEKLRAEADGILLWAMEGYRLWQEEGLGDPPDVIEARQAWRDECDPLADFIAERCRLDPNVWVSSSELRSGYERWCAESGEKYPLGTRTFGNRLRALGCTDERRTVSGKSQRGWVGIELR